MIASRKIWLFWLCITALTVYYSCTQSNPQEEIVSAIQETAIDVSGYGLAKLSEYGFFSGNMVDLIPVEGILPYDLITPLFSDYAQKARFLKIPEGTKAKYESFSVLDFPLGTILIKNFFYSNDFTDASKGRKVLETRLLIHEEKGWKALPYIWNDEQTEATLEIAGGKKEISWVHYDGTQKSLSYSIPNINQCKGCHIKGSEMKPIGPAVRHLNRDFEYADGSFNQIEKLLAENLIEGVPENREAWPKVPVWNDASTGSLTSRARAYLDVNCGHCHRAEGPANTSGLLLDYHHNNPNHLGIYKTPVAAGRGAGHLQYSIVPGKPEESILTFRMKSEDPGVMMPELGRKLIHKEGVAVIEEWIASLNPADY